MTITPLKNKLWELCKQIIREKYRKGGIWYCYTCNRPILEARNAQTGHFIPSGSCGAYLRYNLRNLRIQCYHCNINLGGNGAEFYRAMVKEKGKRHVEKIFQDKQKVIKADEIFYNKKIIQYKKILAKLSTNNIFDM